MLWELSINFELQFYFAKQMSCQHYYLWIVINWFCQCWWTVNINCCWVCSAIKIIKVKLTFAQTQTRIKVIKTKANLSNLVWFFACVCVCVTLFYRQKFVTYYLFVVYFLWMKINNKITQTFKCAFQWNTKHARLLNNNNNLFGYELK